ncbi:MAG: hypothetical protein ACXWJK_12850 [Burkholderiaceae bacterium]
MATISIIKAPSFANEPINVDAISDCVFSPVEGVFKFTGYLGALSEKAVQTGARFKLQIVADQIGDDMLFRARVSAGHGPEQITSRMDVTPNLFYWMAALESEKEFDLVHPAIHTVEIIQAGKSTFIPFLN